MTLRAHAILARVIMHAIAYVVVIGWAGATKPLLGQTPGIAEGVLAREQFGAQANGRFGHVVTTLRDLDGDGVRDYAVAAPSEGRVRIYSAGSGSLIREIPAETPSSAHGAALAADDFNGDGIDDLVVGAPLFDPPTVAACFPGKTYVYSGADGSVLFTSLGIVQGAGHGTSVAAVGDVNGDLVPDFAVGSPYPFGLGRVTLYSGAGGAPLYTILGDNASPHTGLEVVALGDVDADGRGDFAVASLSSVIVYSGAVGAVHMILNQSVGRIANVGDVDGDGVADLALGGGTGGAAGPVSVVSGDTGVVQFVLPPFPGALGFGLALSAAGDTNGDGVADVAIGAPRGTGAAGAFAGLVFVVSGVDGALLWQWTQGQPDSQSGISLAQLDDLNCDGASEMLVGADFRDAIGMPNRGAVLVLAAPPMAPPRFVRGDANGDGTANLPDVADLLSHLFLGATLACAAGADANDDGRLDLTDAVRELGALFGASGPLPAPYPGCGVQATIDLLCCQLSPCP